MLRDTEPCTDEIVEWHLCAFEPVSYTHLDVYKRQELTVGKGRMIRDGKDLAVVSLGHPGNVALEACQALAHKNIETALYDIRFLKPIDEELLHSICNKYNKIVTLEDGSVIGGLGSTVTEFVNDNGYSGVQVYRLGIPDRFVEQGTLEELHHECGIDLEGIVPVSYTHLDCRGISLILQHLRLIIDLRIRCGGLWAAIRFMAPTPVPW